MLFESVIAFLALEAGSATAATLTGTGAYPAPLFPGPGTEIPNGPHPAYTWPPAAVDSPAGAGETCQTVQYNFPKGTNSNTAKANAVRNLYEASWNQYAEYCFGHDQLLTQTNTCADDIFGWGATIVDGMDTAILMNLTDIVTRQLAFVQDINFSEANSLVDGFDAVIRYLGGLLSAYDILTSGYVPAGTYDEGHINSLLAQAKTLGDNLKAQFNTPSGLPVAQINITTGELYPSTFTAANCVTYNASNTAQAGTLILEFYRLADLTGDGSFRTLADQDEGNLIFPYPQPLYPGLIGSEVDSDTGNYLTYDIGWHAGIDSFYETYYYQPSSDVTANLKDFWVNTAESTEAHIALHPYDFPSLTYITQADSAGNIEYAMDDYACFAGGNLLLGGAFLNRLDILNLGVAVTDSCHHLYNTTKTGLGPLAWAWYNGSNLAYNPSDDTNAAERASGKKYGYFIPQGNAQYGSFPETIESIFYTYRITGESRWQDYNWGIYEALVATGGFISTPSSPINNVNVPGSWSSELPRNVYPQPHRLTFAKHS